MPTDLPDAYKRNPHPETEGYARAVSSIGCIALILAPAIGFTVFCAVLGYRLAGLILP